MLLAFGAVRLRTHKQPVVNYNMMSIDQLKDFINIDEIFQLINGHHVIIDDRLFVSAQSDCSKSEKHSS